MLECFITDYQLSLTAGLHINLHFSLNFHFISCKVNINNYIFEFSLTSQVQMKNGV